MRQLALNIDCLEYMKTCKDKQFNLAIVDPPYDDGKKVSRTGGTWAEKYGKKNKTLYNVPNHEFFDELFRISENQIIWGANYFKMPPTRCFLVWEKLTISENFTMAMCEYAWTSFDRNAKLFKFAPQDKHRFHPNQKPVALYKWILSNFAKEGDTIFDSHLGSGSSRIAAYDLGFEFVGCELSEKYFDLQEKRFKEHCSQLELFEMKGGKVV
ncbi:MAG: DNA modification methylase [Treponema sp.]|nr:MAG: DNA modification methylase [Treponema sp.]